MSLATDFTDEITLEQNDVKVGGDAQAFNSSSLERRLVELYELETRLVYTVSSRPAKDTNETLPLNFLEIILNKRKMERLRSQDLPTRTMFSNPFSQVCHCDRCAPWPVTSDCRCTNGEQKQKVRPMSTVTASKALGYGGLFGDTKTPFLLLQCTEC